MSLPVPARPVPVFFYQPRIHRYFNLSYLPLIEYLILVSEALCKDHYRWKLSCHPMNPTPLSDVPILAEHRS